MTIKSNTPDNPDLNKQDNEFFDAYLEGGSPLSEIYNTIDCVEPSNKLSQSILSAASASAEQSSDPKSWWTQAGSWAASVAIISLVGVLAHNTWQAEQDAVHKEIQGESPDSFLQPQTQPQQGRLAKPEPVSKADKAEIESDVQIEQTTQAHSRAKKGISPDNSKDSRKLLYKSAPAPVMQSAPAYFKPDKTESLLKESYIQQFEDSHEPMVNSYEPTATSQEEAKKSSLTEQQMMLNKITQLIENSEINQAQELLFEFKTKYPDYPVDPVLLKHLSPY